MFNIKFIFPLFLLFPLVVSSQHSTVRFEEWISLKQSGNPIISPDGNHIVYSVTSTDWKENSYDTEYWLINKEGKPFQITRTTKGNSNGAKWSPDSKWIAFLADRGNKNQIYLLSVDGGEAFFITNEADGINSFDWSPNGKELLITKTEAESKKDKEQKDRYGAFGMEGTEYKQVHLWIIPFNIDSIELAGMYPCYADSVSDKSKLPCFSLPKAKRITEGDFTVTGYKWSPNGKYIAYNRTINPLINSGIYSDIAVY
nr:PD40 domain-containing protein [Saprospiraceae bacterium]